MVRGGRAGQHGPVHVLLSAAADLVFGSRCSGCHENPGLLCVDCRLALENPAEIGVIPGTVALPVASVSDYVGITRDVIIEHKEHGRLALARPLGDALAVSVTGLMASDTGCPSCGERPLAMVPAPSRSAAVRSRGHDPLLRMARRAGMILRRGGQPSSVVRALQYARGVVDQSGLDRQDREANVHGSIRVRAPARRRLDDRCIVVVDDIVTTGATLREAVRAMATEGHRVCGAAVVAVVV